MVPDAFRRLLCTSAEALRVYGIGPVLLQELMDLGLPHSGHGEATCFDRFDLENIGLDLRLPSKNWSTLRLWARQLTGPDISDDPSCQVRVSWRCPDPGHDGECRFTLSPQLRAVVGCAAQDMTVAGSLTIDGLLEDESCDFGEAFCAVVEAVQALTFHRLPASLAKDEGFLAETRLADCRSATPHLVRVAASAGLAARPASGLFVGVPFPAPHAWLEVKTQERWVAADPFFLMALQRWGVLDAASWPITLSPRKVLWRLDSTASMEVPLVLHGEGRAHISLMALR